VRKTTTVIGALTWGRHRRSSKGIVEALAVFYVALNAALQL
jgi:hypothetical protein